MFNRFEAIGADPEVFFFDPALDMPRSVEGLLGGTKAEPKPIPKYREGFAVQEDNVAAEFNIPVARDAKEFSVNIAQALKYLDRVAKNNKMQVLYKSAANFSPADLLTPHAQNLGCDPDFNAWLMQTNPRPRAPERMRTAAGHVHISWKEPTDEERALLVRTLDLYLGVPSVLSFPFTGRRELYGKAGACRFKSYGVEYRVLGNEWLNDHGQREYVFNSCLKALMDLTKSKQTIVDFLDDWKDEIQQAINNNNKDFALRLMYNGDVTGFPQPKEA
jgi:hypothetical protein